ncbi:hypothetical protein A2U01_0089495, partial [Trifolium medium]|nr:hypothetical protein [Trifolium medium]
SRVAPTPEGKQEKQSYTARCAEPAARCANTRRLNRSGTLALRVAPETKLHAENVFLHGTVLLSSK